MDNAREVLQAELDKSLRKAEALRNALNALNGDSAEPVHTPSTPTISPREFERMDIAAAIEKLLMIVNKPLSWDEILTYLKQGNAELSKDPTRHMRQIKTSSRMNSHPNKAWHKLRINDEAGTVSLRLWDRKRQTA
jgi:hypothetical protein